MIDIHFWGAAGEVTGSMHEVSVNGQRVLLDCGMYQGHRKQAEQQNREFPFRADSVDAVVLSHAHIDHSGNLPLLVKQGFSKSIYATSATVDLCDAMLRDTARIQESDTAFVNKRQRQRSQGEPDVEPLYDSADAAKTMPLFHQVNYHEPYQVVPSLQAEAFDAGHMLGSSSIVLTHTDQGKTVKLVFSGDVGRPGLPIVRDPEALPPVDYLIMESTYGDRLHQQESEVMNKLRDIVSRTVARGGRVVVPAFAVGRVQQLVLMLHQLIDANQIPQVPMYVDSPLAVDVTRVFEAHPECYDEETAAFLKRQEDPFGFKLLQYVRESEDSKKLNTLQGPYIVISPSGMCEAGRVLHHLRHNIGDARNTVLITGYQAENTLGRRIQDGQKQVRIFGDPVTVRAEIENLDALSGHGDRDELLAWMKPMAPGLKKVFLVHGETGSSAALAQAIHERYGIEAIPAVRGSQFSLG